MNEILEYKKNMINANSILHGCGSLEFDAFDVWLKKCQDWSVGKNLPDGYCPSSQFVLIRKADKKVIGMIQIRHKLTAYLLNYGGHIGDSIAVDERKKGYGKILLKLGLEKCKELGIENVLITCDDTNIASKKCILANRGQYEDTRYDKDDAVKVERYWVDLEK